MEKILNNLAFSEANTPILILIFSAVFIILWLLVFKKATIYQLIITSVLLLIVIPISYMSVYGFVKVFSESFYACLALGIGMEYGKILLVVQLHRRYHTLKKAKYLYMLIILILTSITTAELGGFLAQSHTASSESVAIVDTGIEELKAEKRLLEAQMAKIEKGLDEIPDTWVSAKLKGMKESGYYEKEKRLFELVKLLRENKEVSVTKHMQAGPIFAISRIMGISDEDAIKWFILILISVIEPLSIGLTVAVSDAWANGRSALFKKYKDDSGKKPDKKKERTNAIWKMVAKVDEDGVDLQDYGKTLIEEKADLDVGDVSIKPPRQKVKRKPFIKKGKLYNNSVFEGESFKKT